MSVKTLLKQTGIGCGLVGSTLAGATGTYFSLPFLKQSSNSNILLDNQAEIHRLEGLLEENISMIKNGEREVKELGARIKQRELEMLAKANSNGQNEEQIAKNKQTIDELNEKLGIQLTSIREIDLGIGESQRLLAEQLKNIEGQSRTMAELNQQITSREKSAKTESDEQDRKIKANEDAINQKNSEIAKQKEANKLQRDSIENEQRELAKLKKDLEEKTSQLQSAQAEKQRIEESLRQEKEKLTKAIAESNRLRSDLRNKNSNYKQAEEKNKQQRKQIAQDKAKIARLKGEETTHKTSLQTKTKILSILSGSNNDQAEKIREHEETKNRLQNQISEKEKKISELKTKLPGADKNLKDAKEKIKQLVDWMNIDFQDIAGDSSKSFDFLNIEKNKVTLSGKTSGSSTFTIGEPSQSKTITVQSNDFKEKSKIDVLLQKYWKEGFEDRREEVGSGYDSWIQNPRFTLKTYELCDDQIEPENESFSACGVKEDDIDIREYFKKDWRKYATQALFSLEPFVSTGKISRVSTDTFKLTATDYKDTTQGNVVNVKSNGEKYIMWQNSFPNKENFIKYWTLKTKELINRGRMDFSDVISPIIDKNNY